MNTPYTICHVVHDYYPSIGGVEIQTKNLAEGLSKKGYKNIIFTKRVDPTYPEIDIINGLEVIRKAYPSTNTKAFQKFIGLVLNTHYLFVNRHRYQIIHLKAPFFELMIPCWILKTCFNVKVVYALSTGNELCSVQGRFLSKMKISLKRFILSAFDAVIVMNKDMLLEANEFGIKPSKVRYIINGVESNRFVPRDSKKMPGQVIFIGRIDENKGIDILLKAWKIFIRSYRNAHLTIAGPHHSHEYAELLNKYIDSNGLKDTVSMLGEIEYYSDSIVDYYQSGEIFILPSRREGMPGTLMQAMSCGLPVISTKVHGAEDLVIDGVNGFLVEIDDEVALSNALINYFNMDESEQEEFGRCSRSIIVEKYGQEKRIDQFVELFSSI